MKACLTVIVTPCFSYHSERNKGTVHALNLPVSTIYTIYTERKLLKAAKVTNGPTNSKVVSFSWCLITDKMEMSTARVDWRVYKAQYSVNLYLRRNQSVFLTNETTLYNITTTLYRLCIYHIIPALTIFSIILGFTSGNVQIFFHIN